MQISYKSLFNSSLECQNKLYFRNNNKFVSQNSDNSFFKIGVKWCCNAIIFL